MGDRLFAPEELSALRVRFEEVEEVIGREHEVFAKFAEGLEASVREG